jgi:hypothetical protein
VSLTFHSILRKLYTEPSIGASYQISINLTKWFWRRFFSYGQSQTRMPMRPWKFCKCEAVSEEKIKIGKVNKCQEMAKAQVALGKVS